MVSPDTAERTGIVWPRHRRDGIAPTPQSGEGLSRHDTAEQRGMVSPRHHRADRDGLAPAPKGWNRPDTAERRGVVTPQYRRAESDGFTRHRRADRDGLAPAPQRGGLVQTPQSGVGWSRPDTAERRGVVSPRHRWNIPRLGW